MATTAIRALPFLFTALLAGCSSNADPEASDANAPLEQFLDGRSAAFCEWSVGCGLLPDAQSCVDVGLWDWAQVEADLAAGILEFDQSLARGCLDYLESDAYRACGTSDDDGWDQACGGVLVGTKDEGASCSYQLQCAGSANCDTSMCDVDAACCAGRCVSAGAAGAACGSQIDCRGDHYCDDDGTCRARALAGSECDDSTLCVHGSACGPGDATTRVCVASVGMGGACDPKSANCADWDAWCDPVTNTCARAAEVGEPCTDEAGCLAYAYCDGTFCMPLGSVGDPCSEGCLIYLSCSGDVCSAPPSAPCTLP